MISDIMGCLGVIVQGKIYRRMHGKERLTKNEEARCRQPTFKLHFPLNGEMYERKRNNY